MSTYIYASSAISTQSQFVGKIALDSLVPVEKSRDLIEPNYSEYIKPMVIRRMSKATKMSVACAFSCLKAIENPPLDAIIVGTGLGAITDTEKFLKVSITSQVNMLPPTAFIQSGHNSIAGQIALLLKNDCYNMTHVQQGLSFEHALLDAILNVSEGKKKVLLGAVDEKTDLLNEVASKFKLDKKIKNQFSEGATFFVLGAEKAKSTAKVKSVVIVEYADLEKTIYLFLESNFLNYNKIGKAFVGNNLTLESSIQLPIDTLVYTNFVGRHFSSSAYGVHVATEYLQHTKSAKFALVINIASSSRVGLTLIESV